MYKDYKQVFPEWQYTYGQGETRIGKNRENQAVNHIPRIRNKEKEDSWRGAIRRNGGGWHARLYVPLSLRTAGIPIRIFLGNCSSREEAALRCDEKLIQLFGLKRAQRYLNFPGRKQHKHSSQGEVVGQDSLDLLKPEGRESSSASQKGSSWELSRLSDMTVESIVSVDGSETPYSSTLVDEERVNPFSLAKKEPIIAQELGLGGGEHSDRVISKPPTWPVPPDSPDLATKTEISPEKNLHQSPSHDSSRKTLAVDRAIIFPPLLTGLQPLVFPAALRSPSKSLTLPPCDSPTPMACKLEQNPFALACK
jgi:hypothetical protein